MTPASNASDASSQERPPAEPESGAGTVESADADRGAGFFDANTLSFLGLIAFPILALVCAVMGLVMVVQGHVFVGLVFLLVLTQAFAIGGLIVWTRRRRLNG